ncbi:MAG TPA: hypothetical protein VKB13_09050 [Gaiellaceae bacterium]|nr:hypothetical protein [Gaiellaceae bacterium]
MSALRVHVRRRLLIAALAAATATVSGCGSDEPRPLTIRHRLDAKTRALFAYERNRPLRIGVRRRTTAQGVTVEDLTYRSPGNGTIAAYVVKPAEGNTGEAGIVFLHWTYNGPDRDEFLGEARSYAKHGVTSLLVGEKRSVGNSDMVVDIERGVDLLLEREHVDPARIGFVGHSMGAVVGGVVAGVETRIRAYVLMAGSTGFPPFPEPFIGQAAPARLFFQFGKRDEIISPDDAREYAVRASEPKRVGWYDAEHDLNDARAREDRAEWLREQLGFDAAGNYRGRVATR